MAVELFGVVHGSTIKLSEDPGIPDGAEVVVTVRAASPESRPWGEGIRRSAGVAVDVPGFDEAFAMIERERNAAQFRDSPP